MRFWIWVQSLLWHRRAAYHAVRDASARVCEFRPPFVDLALSWGQRAANASAIAFHRQAGALDDRVWRSADALDAARAEAARTRGEGDRSRAAWQAREEEADRLHAALNPPTGPWTVSRGTYKLAVLGTCLGDLPLTYLAFQTFDLDPVMTLMISCLVVLLLGALGHFAGHYARRLNWSEGLLLAVVLTLALSFVSSLTYLRETAMRAVAADEAVNPLGPLLVFATVTALGFVVPTLLAYHVRQEPHAHLVRVARQRWHDLDRAARRAERWLAEARQAHRRAVQQRQALGAQTLDTVEIIRSVTGAVVHRYRLHYVREREGVEPSGLRPGALPTVTLPATLLRELERAATPLQTGEDGQL